MIAVDLEGDDELDETDAELDVEMVARLGLREFVRLAWDQVEKSQALTWSWHLDALCEHLEAVFRGEDRDLVINIPPGCSKSLITSVLYPAWVWTQKPGHRFIAVSYSDRVVLRDAEKMRTLVKGAWYQERWPHVEIPQGRAQSDAVSIFRTTAGGFRYSTTVRGQLTGEHCDTMIVDDPIDPLSASAASGVEIELVLQWWNGTAQTRFRDHKTSARVCIMQRLHQRDLAGEMINAGATVLCLPMRYDPGHPHKWPGDPRTEAGELLVPERTPEDAVLRLEKALGPHGAAAQLGQRPAPKGGAIFKAEWFQFWTELPKSGTWCLSIDCTFKKTDDGSFVVIQVWFRSGPNFYLVDQHRERMSLPETLEAVRAMCAKYPRAFKKLVEDKANGSAVVDTLKRELPGLELVEPEGGKEARAYAVQPLVAGKNVFLPDPKHARYLSANDNDGRVGARWVTESEPGDPTPGGFVGEVTVFPRAGTDDQVDGMTQYLNSAAPSYAERLRRAMEKAA